MGVEIFSLRNSCNIVIIIVIIMHVFCTGVFYLLWDDSLDCSSEINNKHMVSKQKKNRRKVTFVISWLHLVCWTDCSSVTEWPGSDVQHVLDPDHPLIVQTQTLRVIIKPQTLETGIALRVCGAKGQSR